MANLENRIKNIASNMEGNFKEIDGHVVSHSKFVEWDQTWTLFEGEDDEEYSVTPDSTDKEIEEAILAWERSHDDYYDDEVQAYINEQENN